MDSTVFCSRYHHLMSVEPGAMRIETNPAPVHLLIPETFGNSLLGETHGIETFATWKVARNWTLNPGHTFLSMHLHEFAGSQDGSIPGTQGSTPDHQAQLRSTVNLPWNLRWNASGYFVNRLPAQSIPAYTRVDTGLTWRLGESISLNLAGQNLLKDLHPEYSGPNSTVQSGLMRRAAYARIIWTF